MTKEDYSNWSKPALVHVLKETMKKRAEVAIIDFNGAGILYNDEIAAMHSALRTIALKELIDAKEAEYLAMYE